MNLIDKLKETVIDFQIRFGLVVIVEQTTLMQYNQRNIASNLNNMNKIKKDSSKKKTKMSKKIFLRKTKYLDETRFSYRSTQNTG